MKKKKQEEEDFSFLDLEDCDLSHEWRRQAKLLFRYAKRLARARKANALAKRELEVISAELKLDIRRNPDEYDIPKITDDSVSSALAAQPKIIAAQDKLIESKYDMDILEAAVNALEHRKRSLENLVDLWTRDYFADPHAKGEVSQEKMEEIRKRDIYQRGKNRER